jgi:cellulose synthase/poly-beta-1,6-N-acetylglucosamine synthase-like glycosyltransferase
VTKWSIELHKLIYTHVVLIGIPTILYYCLRVGGWNLINLHMAIATFYLASALIIIAETTNALFRRFATDQYSLKPGRFNQFHQLTKSFLGVGGAKRPEPKRPVPRCSFLIAAYLPNEQAIILDTLRHILLNVQRPEDGLEVILTYNTPIDLPIEEDLHSLAQTYPELRLLRVEGSRSKAENLNAALEIVTGKVACVLDADHHPAPDCFFRAWRWIERGYDVIQGRNIIRNHAQNLLTENIAIEFETLYGISHAAKSFITDSSIFGGSNGYWRTSVLKQIRFNPIMLTEDIDASMRTLLNGYRILHDRSIVTTELAPVDGQAFWFQRKRWAQGWLEVSLKYQRRVWRSDKFSLWQKIYWTYLLYFCELYSIIAIQIIPVVLSLFIYQGSFQSADNQYLFASTVVALFAGAYQTLATAKIASVRYPIAYYIKHMLLLFPYITFKNMIAVVGLYDHLHGNNGWLITPRGKQSSRHTLPHAEPVLASGASSLSSGS